jgi:molybdopterin-binding protein
MGTLLFKNRDIKENLTQMRKVVTMIFQTPVFLNGDVYTNVAYPLRLRKLGEKEILKRIEEALKTVRLDGYEKRIARDLSGGEQQRIALARALVLEPEVLLLDEPTSNLDPANISVISKVIEDEGKERTIIISTHDYDQIRRLTHRTIHLENGSITEEGVPTELVSIAMVTENVFSGNAEIEDGVGILETGRIVIRTTSLKKGTMTVHVSPEDIILSKDWITTSARNQFRGPIIGFEDKGNVVKLKIDSGEVFTVQITKKSLNELDLRLGAEVNLSFKASSVTVI